MLNQDVTYFYGEAQAVYKDFGGVVFEPEEGERLAAALGPNGKGMILRSKHTDRKRAAGGIRADSCLCRSWSTHRRHHSR